MNINSRLIRIGNLSWRVVVYNAGNFRPCGLHGTQTKQHTESAPEQSFSCVNIRIKWRTRVHNICSHLTHDLSADALKCSTTLPEPSQLETAEQLLRAGCHLVEGRSSNLDNAEGTS